MKNVFTAAIIATGILCLADAVGSAAANAHGAYYHPHGVHHHGEGYYYDHHHGTRVYECHAGSRYRGCHRPHRGHSHGGVGISIYGIFK